MLHPTMCFSPQSSFFLRHIVRKGGIKYQVLTKKVERKRDRGRLRLIFLGWLGKCLDWVGVDINLIGRKRSFASCISLYIVVLLICFHILIVWKQIVVVTNRAVEMG